MLTRTRRLAIALATALLGIGFGMGGRAEAATILTTPAGLSPGQSFRFVFVTDGTTTATSSNIADYNNFVNAQAGGATYNGAVVTWQAIASTATVNAIDNVGQTTTPVYLSDGTRVTTSTTPSGLWSGNLEHPIYEDLTGLTNQFLVVWTGTNQTGTNSGMPLGAPTGVTTIGQTGSTNEFWVNGGFGTPTQVLSVYGISQVLTAPVGVPEPTSLSMAVTAIGAGFASAWSRRRRRQRWQRPEGQTDTSE